MTMDSNANGAGNQPSAVVASPPDLPPAFEASLQKLLEGFHGNDTLSLSVLMGAAILRFGEIERSLARLSGAVSVVPPESISVTLHLDPNLDDRIFTRLDALSKDVKRDEDQLTKDEGEFASFQSATQSWQEDSAKRLARLEEHFGHLRAHFEGFERQAATFAETQQKDEAAIKRDHRKFTEEFAALGQRIEALEHTRKTTRS